MLEVKRDSLFETALCFSVRQTKTKSTTPTVRNCCMMGNGVLALGTQQLDAVNRHNANMFVITAMTYVHMCVCVCSECVNVMSCFMIAQS